MLASSFVNSLSEEEKSLLYLIVYNTCYRMCGMEPDFNYVHLLRAKPSIIMLEKLRNKIKTEHLASLESLKNKLVEYK
jgi:hypothetical protein